jgi:hypothetical protein
LWQLVDEEKSEDGGIKNVVSDFGRAPLGRELRPFQIEGASYLVNGEPGKVLAMIIQPGLGKSLSYIVAGCLHCGITLVFQPTLTLGADQCSKLNLLREKANLKAYNLHDYKTPESWNPIVNELKSLSHCPIDAVPRVFLIVSPECVTDQEKPWANLFLELATVNLIRLLVVDEFHIWRQQGVSFRPEMNKTGKKIIAEITKVSPLTSVVFLTATSQWLDIAVLESIYGVRVRRIIWGSPREMQKRCVKIEMACRSQYLVVAKQIVAKVVAKTDKKFIVYTDFPTNVENIAHSLREMASDMKEDCEEVDFLEITGNDPLELKAFIIDMFCENVMAPDEKALLKLYRGLVATSGVASTGVDPPPNLELVSRKGLPPSASTAFQEIGRLQRGDAAPDGVYLYHITVNVNSYAKLLLRTQMSENAKQDEKYRSFDDHFQVLKMLVLGDVCLHFAFETMFGRPGSSDTSDASCAQSALFAPVTETPNVRRFTSKPCDDLSQKSFSSLRQSISETRLCPNSRKLV